MHMLTRRLHILLDDERYARIAEEAQRRGVAVALIVREAIDTAYPSQESRRRAALQRILDADPVPVPDDPADLKREIYDARSHLW